LLKSDRRSQSSKDRIVALEEIGFQWSIYDSNHWWKRYFELKAFREQHGHCNVPHLYEKNKLLGSWVNTQRT